MNGLKRDDFERESCTCPACYQAGVSERPQLRSTRTGAWMHGEELRRVYEARDKFWALVGRKTAERAKEMP